MIRSFPSFCLSFLKTTTQVRLENLFLRKQMEILARMSTRPRLRPSDRIFFSVMTDLFSYWKETLLVFKPDTVIRWHRESFRLYWRWKSRSEAGRPKIPQSQINLIKQMANDNPLWGAPRIHGELLKLGIDISESTVLRYMPKKTPRTSQQRWKTFLRNHSAEIISLDLSLVKIPSACKIASPNYFRYFVLCTNQPDRSPDAQIFPLLLPLTLQITHATSPRNPVSQKTTRDSHTLIPQTSTKPFRQVPHEHSDGSFRLLEGCNLALEARDRHPVAPAKLQSILEMEE
jgi:hypothetical protein